MELSPLQSDYHGSYASGIAAILRKKFLTPYDMQKMQLLLASMRMVCDSTYLIDEETNESPKLEELQQILIEKLDVPNRDTKIIIFSEWVKSTQTYRQNSSRKQHRVCGAERQNTGKIAGRTHSQI